MNYNSVRDTIACISSVREFCPPRSYVLCVVDNGSRSEVVDKVRATLRDGDKYILSAENVGYARGNNLGLEYFDTVDDVDKILILNNDILLTRDIVTPLTEYLDSHPSCGAVSPLLRDRNGNIDLSCARRFKSPCDLAIKAGSLVRLGIRTREFMLRDTPSLIDGEDIPVDLPSGACLMLRKRDFASVGRFDPATFLYFEEDILCTKLARAGLTAVVLPGISAIHLGACTTSSQPSARIYGYWRESLLYYMEHYTDCPHVLLRYIRFRTAIGQFFKK